AYIVFAAGAAIALWNPRSRVAGALVMSGLACAMAISRSAGAMLPLAAAILAIRVTLADEADPRGTAISWLGVLPGALGAAAMMRSMAPARWATVIVVTMVAGVL